MANQLKVHGKKIRCPEGYQAYVPDPLPPPIEWQERLARHLSDADRLIGQLAMVGAGLPNPHLLIRPFVRREAVLSSRIEGTQTSLAELFADEAGAETSQDHSDLKEVESYVKALEYGIKRLKTLPISLRLICEIHEHLTKGVRGNRATPGEFRRSQNWIGVAGCTLQNATYVPPPPSMLMDCLSALEKFFHESRLPPLVTIGLIHPQFEAIHPFLDGNGRVGRLLIILYLVERGILPSPILYLSAFFEATRDEYYARLHAITETGDWEGWIEYFLNGIARQAEDAVGRIKRMQETAARWRQGFTAKSDKNCLILIDDSMTNPFMTVGGIARKHLIAFPTAQRAIDKLEKGGILKQTNDAKRNRIYCARRLLDILDEPAKLHPAVNKKLRR
ncbi:MAG: Fic family protein [Deltaproteobacteria bacterium]|nr:Fic family protein [Deltaproteobacteria bacterium]